MRIAVLDSWPNLEASAEKEFIQRFCIACGNLGIECKAVVTSDDIQKFAPDVVLTTHEFSRKTTAFPTIGLQWSPLSFFEKDAFRLKSVMSYDGYLVGNDDIRQFITDINFLLPTKKPICKSIFLPTSYKTSVQSLMEVRQPTVCYVGIRWDGDRHTSLFSELHSRELCTFYGPQNSWKEFGASYKGVVPFDGISLMRTIASHGLVLCLHKDEHRIENTPSMRLFETLSVGALPICDQIRFAQENLKDIAYFVDATKTAEEVADQIQSCIDHARNHPDEARRRAIAGKAWFDEHWSLEKKISQDLVPFISEVKECMFPSSRCDETGDDRGTRIAAPLQPRTQVADCQVIVRTGSRSIDMLDRALSSLREANTEGFRISARVVDYKGRDDIEAHCRSSASDALPILYMRVPDTGFRSSALWHGINAVDTKYVSHLDDDDTVFPNHYLQLHAALSRTPQAPLAYTGVIRFEEDGEFFHAINFEGPSAQIIPERRELHFLERFNLRRLLNLDGFIQSNAWMAHTSIVKDVIGDDPNLVVGEDSYLYALLAQKGHFAFTGSPTAMWHWRSKSADNSVIAVERPVWRRSAIRVRTRISGMRFTASRSFDEIKTDDQKEKAQREKALRQRDRKIEAQNRLIEKQKRMIAQRTAKIDQGDALIAEMRSDIDHLEGHVFTRLSRLARKIISRRSEP